MKANAVLYAPAANVLHYWHPPRWAVDVDFDTGKVHALVVPGGVCADASYQNPMSLCVRELPVTAGVGGSLWDASIVCAYENGAECLLKLRRFLIFAVAQYLIMQPNILRGKRCLEVGSGLGVTGLVSACFADQVVMSDLVPELLSNLLHNIAINTVSLPYVCVPSVAYLDWSEFVKSHIAHDGSEHSADADLLGGESDDAIGGIGEGDDSGRAAHEQPPSDLPFRVAPPAGAYLEPILPERWV